MIKDKDDMKELTVKEVAAILGKTPRMIQLEIKAGYIKAELKAGSYFIKPSALKNYTSRPTGVPAKRRK